jgi:hypothetical protein
VTGLGRGLAAALQSWRGAEGIHDPGKIVADLAAALALGGDCLADIAVLPEQSRPGRAGGVRPGGVPAGEDTDGGRADGAGGWGSNLLCVTSPGAPSPRPVERVARLRFEAWHGLFCCWT